MNFWQKNRAHKAFLFSIIGVCVVSILYTFFFNYNEAYHLGIEKNFVSGELKTQNGGFHITTPWVFVTKIDTRPMKVSVLSGGHGYSAKLVQFDENGWREFVQTEGWRYYWWSNRFSFNGSHAEEHRGLRDLLRGHAYSGKPQKFLKVVDSL